MRSRGQFAIEMFFAFTFAILLVFWLVNYLEVFSRASDRTPLLSAQKLIAKDLGRLMNDVCVYGGDSVLGGKTLQLEIDAPCLIQRQQNWYYNISVDTDGRTLLIFSDSTNFTSKFLASCNIEANTNLTSCSQYSKLCIYKQTGAVKNVKIETGACG
ncbi:MAG: hypothetical protein ABH863_01280 [Candidatus Micrarchaeota archaeon]